MSIYYWTNYQRDERRWARFAYWTKLVLGGIGLAILVWGYAVLVFSL